MLIKRVGLVSLAALAAGLLAQTPFAQADDQGSNRDARKHDRDHRDANVTFTKWVTSFPNQPGLIAAMEGVVGGDVGDGLFTGEVLKLDAVTVPGVIEIVALYHFHGPKHSFTALNHVVQTTGSDGISRARITGVVTEGWLQGHAIKGEYTVIQCDHAGLIAPNTTDCFEGYLKIERGD